ncbi:MAG: hypothetical protein QW272_05085 [Candidatus Methanomethylicaceae archaeon]
MNEESINNIHISKEIKKKEEEKTPEEKIKSKNYEYVYGEMFKDAENCLLKYMKENDIPFSRIKKLESYYRECVNRMYEIIQKNLKKEEIERIFLEEAKKFFEKVV